MAAERIQMRHTAKKTVCYGAKYILHTKGQTIANKIAVSSTLLAGCILFSEISETELLPVPGD